MRHAELISKMTLAEKCAFLSGRDEWHTRGIERLNIPPIKLSDGPSGLRSQGDKGDHLGLNKSTPATSIPSAATVANSWDESVAEMVGSIVGGQAADQDVQVLLGPGLNTKRSPLCGRNFEYYSEDPYLSGKLAAAFIRGAQSKGVSACAKHFAANSQEMRRMHSDSVLDERTLREMYLTNFEIAVKEGRPRAIMTSYNRVNGTYTNENSHLLAEILRGEWGHKGIVVTDWGGSNEYVEGVRAGMNLEMPAAGDESALQLMQAIKAGKISEDTVNERVDCLLDLIDDVTANRGKVKADYKADHISAGRAAEASIVLLKNDNDVLPLSRNTRVAFIGDFVTEPRYQGAGSSMVNAVQVDKTSDLLRQYFPSFAGIAKGFERLDTENEELAAAAESLARGADAVLMYMGLTESYETEGLDRTHLRLPANQVKLLERIAKVNQNIIVVLSAGSAVEMPWLGLCRGLVYGGLGGEAGAGAMLRVLAGEVCPGGKLAETFPETLESLPVTKYYPGTEATSEYREGLFVGYRATETAGIKVNFPFGYGLSYTDFEYSNINVDGTCVSFDIKNTGLVEGAETAQLYVSLPGAKVFRPVRELKGFKKVTLKPGETQTVRIAFDDKTFRYFNVATNRFEIEGGTYLIQIGASVQDIRLKAELAVKGTTDVNPYEGRDVSCYQNFRKQDITDAQFRALLGHAIPAHEWDRKGGLTMNDTVSQMFYARNPIARFACKKLAGMVDGSLKKGKPDLNLLFIYNIPFRGMAKMMGGMVSFAMAEDMVYMCNGHGFRGCGRLIKHFFTRPKLPRDKQEQK